MRNSLLYSQRVYGIYRSGAMRWKETGRGGCREEKTHDGQDHCSIHVMNSTKQVLNYTHRKKAGD